MTAGQAFRLPRVLARRLTTMPRALLLSLFGTLAVGLLLPAAPAPFDKRTDTPAGILVLDNCDEDFEGKNEYRDNLTLFRGNKRTFRITGFNNCEALGSARMIATDPARKC